MRTSEDERMERERGEREKCKGEKKEGKGKERKVDAREGRGWEWKRLGEGEKRQMWVRRERI